MEYDMFELAESARQKKELTKLVVCNDKTEQFGLTMTEQEANELIVCRNESLKRYNRVEFGNGILDRLVYEFCDSQYIDQQNYVQILKRLQDIFYEFKNESQEQLTDDELITAMRKLFEEECGGDLDYLEESILPEFMSEIRA